MDPIASALAGLFPPAVVVVVAGEEMWDTPLHPDEEPLVARAVAKRRREVQAGRAAARQALTRLGAATGPILAGPRREPLWPAGVVGSISHTAGLCAVAVAWARDVVGIGLDVEGAGGLSPGVAARIASAREREQLAKLPPRAGLEWGRLVFSAKESLYKCWYPLAFIVLGFEDVEVTVAPEAGTFTAEILEAELPTAIPDRRLEGRFAVLAEHVATAVTLVAGN